MRWLVLIFVFLCQQALAQVSSCSSAGVVAGPVTLKCTQTRTTGISPLMVFFDCSTTTDTALTASAAIPDVQNTTNVDNPWQHGFYQVSFGDFGASGTTNWIYGSNPNGNSRDRATGGITAHLYVNNSTVDVTYTAQVFFTDTHSNFATCQFTVTAYSQTGANGFSAANTTCVSASGTFTGCPTGATQLTTASLATATAASHWASNKLLLFRCGDTFTGNAVTAAPNKARADVYPFDTTCRDQVTGRPTFNGGSSWAVNTPGNDVAISNMDFETSGQAGTLFNIGGNNYQAPLTQLTLYNTKANGYNESYYSGPCTQCGLVQVFQGSMGVNQGTFWPLAAVECTTGVRTYNCGNSGNPSFVSVAAGFGSAFIQQSYNAMIGSHFDGTGANPSNGIETVRIPGGNGWFISNTDFGNANPTGAALKFHCNNTQNSGNPFLGSVCVFDTFEDNYFYGTSGAQLAEDTPQNSQYDERLQFQTWDRNLFQPSTASLGLLLSGRNISLRNNVFDSTNKGSGTGIQACRRGVDWNGGGGAPSVTTAPDTLEMFNNSTVNAPISLASGNACTGPAASNSFVANTLCYKGSCVGNSGTANAVNNNSASTATNPNFVGGTLPYASILNYKPTNSAAYNGASTTVPNIFDCAILAWVGGYTLGACSQVAP